MVQPASAGPRRDGLPRVAVLNSYNLPGRRGADSLRVRGFLAALADAGLLPGRDFAYELIDINERPAMDAAIRRLVAGGVDLIHAFGTPNAVTALGETATVPIVYCGAHPEGIGEATLAAPNVTGCIFTLPLTSSYKGFRLVRRLLPRVRTVWTAFFEGTLFVQPAMRELHRSAGSAASAAGSAAPAGSVRASLAARPERATRAGRGGAGRRVWLTGGSGPVGFESLAGLAAIIGLGYRELVFSDPAELSAALEEIDPATGLFMNYTELLHCPGAFEVVVERTAALGIPAIFNNSAQAAAAGLLAGVAADWAKAGRQGGETAARILRGTPPAAIPRTIHPDRVAWINLDTACRLGLDPDPEVLASFDRRLRGEPDAACT
jgi:ABC-type uncharacterized transport system substrate-binding protein